MPKVFISYSHKDETWKDQLVSHLGVLEKEGSLSTWNDRKIKVGTNWFSEIEKAIASAHVAVLLISADFLTSDFILNEEITRIMKKREAGGMKVLPLFVRDCIWEEVSWLKGIQGRPTDGRPVSSGDASQFDKDLADFAREVYAILKEVPEQTNGQTITYLPPNKIDITSLPNTSTNLFGRKKELEILDEAWNNPNTKILSFIAWGGVGKSALTNAWLNDMAEHHYREAERVYGWSFYSQGTKEDTQASADGFLNDALKWFEYDGPPPTSQFEKGRLLAAQIAKKKTLLILDGLEPLQYPPGEMHGHLKDQAMQALLKGLARTMKGLCIITSRVEASDLKSTEGRMTFTHHLGNLEEEASMFLLKNYKIKGSNEELKKASREFKGHALALNLLGSYLKTVHDGDIRKRDLIPALTEDEKHGGHARRVMESYERWFEEGNKPELDILYMLGLFDRPATQEVIEVLKAKPAIPGLTERLADLSFVKWKIALQHLRDLRLLANKENNNESLDCHPLLREHFGAKLQKQNPNGWQEAHSRLYEYYKNKPEKELPDTLEEMEPLFAAVRHGCLAGRHQEAGDDIFWKRIRRKDEQYTFHKLGAFGSDLACLSAFFESLWNRPASGLTESTKAVVLSWAGFALLAVGRLKEAIEPMKADVEAAIKQDDIEGAAIAAGNLSELLLTLGDIKPAVENAKQSLDFANRSTIGFQMETKRSTLADAYFQTGQFEKAEALFLEAEKMQKERQPEFHYLYSLRGFRYCELLISWGRSQEVFERCKKFFEWRLPSDSLLDISNENLLYGKALILQSIQNKSTDFSEASEFLHQAVDDLRKAGQQNYLPSGLLTRATLYHHQKNFPAAWTDLDEAREIAEYGSMQLNLADYYLEVCRVIRAQLSKELDSYKIIENGETLSLSKAEMEEKFQEYLDAAEKLIEKCGYHRRDGELAELRKQNT